jgi:hypothetical protein
MKCVLLLLAIAVCAVFAINERQLHEGSVPAGMAERPLASSGRGAAITAAERSGRGVVTRVLPDDMAPPRHQRFILKLPSGGTVLIAHNIDLAPRVASLAVGDVIEYQGEYISNPEGGVIHWTHRDPKGIHPSGWLKRQAEVFQ